LISPQICHKYIGPTPNTTTVDGMADFLLVSETDRRQDEFRPILFTIHRLGDLLAKDVLLWPSQRRSVKEKLHLHAVFQSTTGIVFFGTPHGGADPCRFMRHFVEKIARL
jgi:hypothetical protein